jgi:hypothetical protein
VDAISTPVLAMLLTLAAIFLGLAAAVQIIQEFYKYLSQSEAKTYRKVLVDFAGPWIEQLFQAGVVNDLQVRGPFQIRKVRPQGVLLPLPKDELLQATERLAPVWVRRTLEQLQVERELQEAKQDREEVTWSPGWHRLRSEMKKPDPADPTSWDAERVRDFLDTWTEPAGEAKTLLVAFRQQFLPDALRIEQFFPQLQRNLEYAYHRRNLRQTFTLAFLLALLFYLPFSELLAQASRPSLAEAVEFAGTRLENSRTSVAEPTQEPASVNSQTVDREELKRQLAELLRQPSDKPGTPLFGRAREKYGALWEAGPLAVILFLFNCLITAFLVSFGAPFWHNLTSALWRVGRDRLDRPAAEEK